MPLTSSYQILEKHTGVLSLICFAGNGLLIASHISGFTFDVIIFFSSSSNYKSKLQEFFCTWSDK